MARKGDLVPDKDRWVAFGEDEVPLSVLVRMARHTVGPGKVAHDRLAAMPGGLPLDERLSFGLRCYAAKDLLVSYGAMFPEDDDAALDD